MLNLVLDFAGKQSQFALTGCTTIGRASDNQVVLPFDGIAPLHAFIYDQGERALLLPVDATKVNGESIAGARILGLGDQVQIGPARLTIANGCEHHATAEPTSQARQSISRAAAPEGLTFHCLCGAVLQARWEYRGRKGRCRHCNAAIIIPMAPHEAARPFGDVSQKSAGAAAVVAPASQVPQHRPLCGICQTAFVASDHVTCCPECQTPFHADCWHENLGCATYGCAQVNALKTGPDIRIEVPPSGSSNLPPAVATTEHNSVGAATPPSMEEHDDFALLKWCALCFAIGIWLIISYRFLIATPGVGLIKRAQVVVFWLIISFRLFTGEKVRSMTKRAFDQAAGVAVIAAFVMTAFGCIAALAIAYL